MEREFGELVEKSIFYSFYVRFKEFSVDAKYHISFSAFQSLTILADLLHASTQNCVAVFSENWTQKFSTFFCTLFVFLRERTMELTLTHSTWLLTVFLRPSFVIVAVVSTWCNWRTNVGVFGIIITTCGNNSIFYSNGAFTLCSLKFNCCGRWMISQFIASFSRREREL